MNMSQCGQCGQEVQNSDNYCFQCGAKIEKYPRPAGFWIRVGASIIDSLIFIPIVILSFLNLLLFKNKALLILTILPSFLYKPLMESFYGATLGKMACGIKVIDNIGQKLDLGTAFLRALPFLLSNFTGTLQSLMLYSSAEFQSATTLEEMGQLQQMGPMDIIVFFVSFLVLVDCIFAAFTYRKRALHDMLAGSYCVYKEHQQQ
jgi:uncharacterized RDD family membrane protein YckC